MFFRTQTKPGTRDGGLTLVSEYRPPVPYGPVDSNKVKMECGPGVVFNTILRAETGSWHNGSVDYSLMLLRGQGRQPKRRACLV